MARTGNARPGVPSLVRIRSCASRGYLARIGWTLLRAHGGVQTPTQKKTAPEGAVPPGPRLRAPATPRCAEADERGAQECERRRLWNSQRANQRQRGSEHRRRAAAFAVYEVECEVAGGPSIRHRRRSRRGGAGDVNDEKAADHELETVVMAHRERLPVDNADRARELEHCSTGDAVQILREVRCRAGERDFAGAAREK